MYTIFSILFPAGTKNKTTLQLSTKPLIAKKNALIKLGINSIDTIYSAVDYDEHVQFKQLLYALKYDRNTAIVQQLLPLLQATIKHIPNYKNYTLIPVSLHWSRLCTRTFNQSALLAKELSQNTNQQYSTCLRRTRSTGSQAKRNRNDRIEALHSAFTVKGSAPKNVLLIDDVWTTGTTLQECAKALRSAGTTNIAALTLAHSTL